MAHGTSSHRRRTNLSVTSPAAGSDPVEQLDRVVEIVYRVNRALPQTALTHEQLIALGGLLTQLSGALRTVTDLLSTPAHHHDRIRRDRADTDITPTSRPPAATSLLRDCRDSYTAAHTAARAFHAGLKRAP